MRFFGIKRTIPVDSNYGQVVLLDRFWKEMRALYTEDLLIGLGTNWTANKFDYYLGKIDEDWQGSREDVNLPDDNWHEYSCTETDKDIEQMYRKIYTIGLVEYELESAKDGIFTAKVHFAKSRGKKV